MRDVEEWLDEVYAGHERISRAEIHRHAVAAELPAELITALGALPEGEYAQDEVLESLGPIDLRPAEMVRGVPVSDLSDQDLLRELEELHRTRNATFRHGSPQALASHDERTAEMEDEYLRRFPDREVDPARLRAGVRRRRTGDPPRAVRPAAPATTTARSNRAAAGRGRAT